MELSKCLATKFHGSALFASFWSFSSQEKCEKLWLTDPMDRWRGNTLKLCWPIDFGGILYWESQLGFLVSCDFDCLNFCLILCGGSINDVLRKLEHLCDTPFMVISGEIVCDSVKIGERKFILFNMNAFQFSYVECSESETKNSMVEMLLIRNLRMISFNLDVNMSKTLYKWLLLYTKYG